MYPFYAKKAFLVMLIIGAVYSSKAQNPLVYADQFNVFVEKDLTIGAGDIEGALGAGGDFQVTGQSNRTANNATNGQAYVTFGGTKYAMVIGGVLRGNNSGYTFTIDGKSGSNNDHYVRIGTQHNTTVTSQSGGIDVFINSVSNKNIRVNNTIQSASGIHSATPLLNFATAFSYLQQGSVYISNLAGNVSYSVSGGQANITLGNNPNNIWNISGAALNTFSQINLSGRLPSASNVLIINVNAAGNFNWNNVRFLMGSESTNSMETNRAPYILWNFYNTSYLSIQQPNTVLGSLLAPNTDVLINSTGNLAGQLIARSLNKPFPGELHIARFSGSVSGLPLPVNLISFTGFQNGAANQLNWEAGEISNLTAYHVERSIDGLSFTPIGTILPIPDDSHSNPTTRYSFTDNQLPPGSFYYYRLRSEEKDGAFSYSAVVKLTISVKPSHPVLTVYPNPFSRELNLELPEICKEKSRLRVTDTKGVTVYSEQIPAITNSPAILKIQLPDPIISGVYHIILETTKGRYIRQVIKY